MPDTRKGNSHLSNAIKLQADAIDQFNCAMSWLGLASYGDRPDSDKKRAEELLIEMRDCLRRLGVELADRADVK
jgi:hypothetical protein